jgi:hypothetical protein
MTMVAVKGMEMPKNCMDCPLFDGEYGTCNIIGKTKADATEERAENCPLVEIATCEDCKYCEKDMVEGIEYLWCTKDDCGTSEDYYCADGERREE